MTENKDLTGLEIVTEIINGSRKVPLHDALKIVFKKATHGSLEAECILDKTIHGNGFNNTAHGGVTMALSDAVCGFAGVTTLSSGRFAAMSNFTVEFRRKALISQPEIKGEPLKAIGTVTDTRGASIWVDSKVYQGEHLIAHSIGTLISPRPKTDPQ